VIEAIKAIIAGILFTFTWEAVPPYSYKVEGVFLVPAAILFASLFFTQKSSTCRNKLCLFGIMTFFLYAIIAFWRWRTNLWYPPQLPIIESFFRIPGIESKMDAEVSNVFIMFWIVFTLLMYGVPFFKNKLRNSSK